MAKKKTVRDARSLADLMRIRAHPPNRALLDGINDNLGTVLGFKKPTHQLVTNTPAIIVFVPHKINEAWLEKHKIRKGLSAPGGAGNPDLRCPLDVVEGGKAVQLPPVEVENDPLLAELQGRDPQLRPGSQLAVIDSRGDAFVATLGAFVLRGAKKTLCFLTNEHVALLSKSIYHPRPELKRSIGSRRKGDALEAVPLEEWYGKFASEIGAENSKAHVDSAIVKLLSNIPRDRIDPGIIKLGLLGNVVEVDLAADMVSGPQPILGQRVLKVGRTTGLRYGTITGFGYEWLDDSRRTRYTDLLIAPDEDRSNPSSLKSIPFSQPGDSGSMVVLENGLRPVGLLWGGYVEKLVTGRLQESWSYVTRLDKILEHFDSEIVRDASQL